LRLARKVTEMSAVTSLWLAAEDEDLVMGQPEARCPFTGSSPLEVARYR
jgi:hypothetical protein